MYTCIPVSLVFYVAAISLVQVMQIECHVKDNKGMVPDTVAMVADFELLGEGLVKKVEVVSYIP